MLLLGSIRLVDGGLSAVQAFRGWIPSAATVPLLQIVSSADCDPPQPAWACRPLPARQVPGELRGMPGEPGWDVPHDPSVARQSAYLFDQGESAELGWLADRAHHYARVAAVEGRFLAVGAKLAGRPALPVPAAGDDQAPGSSQRAVRRD